MLGGGISMIFFKTKGQDFGEAAVVAALSLGWSETVTAALPGIVHCVSSSEQTEAMFLSKTPRATSSTEGGGGQKWQTKRGSSLVSTIKMLVLSIFTRTDAGKTQHRPLVLIAHCARLLDIHEQYAPPLLKWRELIGCWCYPYKCLWQCLCGTECCMLLVLLQLQTLSTVHTNINYSYRKLDERNVNPNKYTISCGQRLQIIVRACKQQGRDAGNSHLTSAKSYICRL